LRKIEKTWSLNEKTVLLAKALAAIFQVTDSQLIENIIITRSIREHAFFVIIGVRLESPRKDGNVIKSDKTVRKTVAVTEETYARLKAIADVTKRRESVVVETFIYDTVNTIHNFYPDLEKLVDAVLSLKKGSNLDGAGQDVLYEIYYGKLTEKQTEHLRDTMVFYRR